MIKNMEIYLISSCREWRCFAKKAEELFTSTLIFALTKTPPQQILMFLTLVLTLKSDYMCTLTGVGVYLFLPLNVHSSVILLPSLTWTLNFSQHQLTHLLLTCLQFIATQTSTSSYNVVKVVNKSIARWHYANFYDISSSSCWSS